MLPLAGLGKGTSLASLKISGGSKPPAEAALAPSPALPIIPTPEGNAVLIASPADSTVVYYMEGMGVPMGSFKTYGRLPRAVGVINRQLRETAPGVYGARVRVPQSGRYDVAFLLDSPRIVQCFEFSAETNPVLSRLKAERPVSLEFVGKERRLKPGEEVRLRFRLTDSATAEPLEQVRDLAVVASLMPTGGWQERYLGRPVGDGVYEITFRAPQAGIYSLNFAIPSMKVKLHQLPGLMLHAEEAGAGR